MKTINFFDLELPKTTTGKVVRAFRKKLGLSQAELAKIIGSKMTNISAIENDKREIGVDQALKLAAAFGLDPSLILFPNGAEEALKTAPLRKVKERAQKVISSRAESSAPVAMVARAK